MKRLIFVLLFSSSCFATTYPAATCSKTDVQAAMNLVTTDGDVVTVPSGSCTWTTGLTSSCHAWTLQGAGSSSTLITVNISGGDAFSTSCSNKLQRITGFTWTRQNTAPEGIFLFTGNPQSFRLDHNIINQVSSWGRYLWVEGPCVSGGGCLLDHNTITNVGGIVSAKVSADSSLNKPGSVTACPNADDCAGATQWNNTMAIDDGSEVYFEDNTFTFNNFFSNDMMDCQNGGRYVFRHNTVTGNTAFDHGWDSVASSCIELTAYNNTMDGSSQAQAEVLYRGGTGVVYSNIMKNSSQANFLVTNYRSNNSGTNSTPPSCTGACLFCGGSNPADENARDHGNACFEQIGRGSGTSSWLGGASHTFSYPLYEWDNCKTSLGCTGTGDQNTITVYNNNGGSTDYTSVEIRQNRDFYDSQSAGCSTTQTTGVCIGLLSARASTCTSGVTYWATDQSKLYQCGASNAWSVYYTPYTYPNPLEGSVSPVAPPALPAKWVDNNEATDGVNCGGNCSGVGFVAPTYEYILGASSWANGPPPTCTFSIPYAVSGAGKQSFINDMEACRTLTGVGIILDVPPGTYSTTNGVTIPQTNNTHATQALIIRSTQDATIAALPEPVCAGGVQDNVSASVSPGLINPDCAGDNLSYQLGNNIITVPVGAFTFANGHATNTSQYNYLQYMYWDVCTATNCTVFRLCSVGSGASLACTGTTFGPDLWLFEDGAASMSVGNIGAQDIINTGTGTLTNDSQMASHVHWRRYWAHGDWTTLTAGRNSVSNVWAWGQCSDCSIVGSQASQVLRPGGEGHIVGGNGTFYKFADDWFEGQSSCIFSGGFSTTPRFNFVPFQDVQIGRVRCTFPYQWLGATLVGNTQWAGQSLVRKNCYENKEGERVLIYGLICENVDNSGGQNGAISDFNIRQTSGTGSTGQNYWATLNDYNVQNSIFRNSCWGMVFAGRSDNSPGNGGGVSYMINSMTISNVLQYNVTGGNPGCPGTHQGMLFSKNLEKWHVNITENSAGDHATAVATCEVGGASCPAGPPGIGFEVFGIRTGEPVTISGCTGVVGFNVSTHVQGGNTVPLGIGPLASTGSAAWTGSFSAAGVTITYPWVATANAVDNSGNCILSNEEGNPSNVNIQHMTFVTDAVSTVSGSQAIFIQNHMFQDSILLSQDGATSAGWYLSIAGEGTPTEQSSYDFTSLTADKLVWPGRPSGRYTAYGNNPTFPVASPTMSFPATPYCTGATSTAACVGFIGAMSLPTGPMPLVLNDYHQYALRSDSSFHNAASDGTDVGAIISSLDTAQTINTYVCAISCGTPGPFPDIINGTPPPPPPVQTAPAKNVFAKAFARIF